MTVYCLYYVCMAALSLVGLAPKFNREDNFEHECSWPANCSGCENIITDTGSRLQTESYPSLVEKITLVVNKTLLTTQRNFMIHSSSILLALYIKLSEAIEKELPLTDLDPSPSFQASHSLVNAMSRFIEEILVQDTAFPHILIAIPSELLRVEQHTNQAPKRRSLLCTSINNLILLLGHRLYDDASIQKDFMKNIRAWNELGAAFVNVANTYTDREERLPSELTLYALDWWYQSPVDVETSVYARIFLATFDHMISINIEDTNKFLHDSLVSVHGAGQVLARMCAQLDNNALLNAELALVFKGCSVLLMESSLRQEAMAEGAWDSLFSAWYRQVDSENRALHHDVWCCLSLILHTSSFHLHLFEQSAGSGAPGSSKTLQTAFMPETYDFCAYGITHLMMAPPASPEFFENLLKLCKYYTLFAKSLPRGNVQRSGSRRNSNHVNGQSRDGTALAKAMQDVWWPTCEYLRSVENAGDMTSEVREIWQVWLALGAFVGLDERKERARFEKLEASSRRAAVAFCGREGCRYHSEKAPGRLRVCKGCGDTAYCSHFCQKTDWKDGGHKVVCKRLTF
ncbi:unnamed protein product [Peniophora sp. CBMAI 1063]|nr:unnamed protein product [Peniophora sp. CBMAI 1063]